MMSPNELGITGLRYDRPKGYRSNAFTLIELLTVVFIISLLIGILLPSIGAARNAAKKASTSKTIEAIGVGLEMFKNDNEKDFRLTNGYPPSFAHRKLPGYEFNAHLGEFPFMPGDDETKPVIYGAHWLPAMLMGVDQLGYIKPDSVPNKAGLRQKPWLWYTDPSNQGSDVVELIDRQSFYLDPGNVKLKATEDLPGFENRVFFPNWDDMKQLPVIVDAFDQPILYYVASKHGSTSNMVEAKRLENNDYDRNQAQMKGVPFFFHQDNEGFTGTARDPSDKTKLGWDFARREFGHDIAVSGEELTPNQLVDPNNRETFARYIIDRNLWKTLSPNTNPSQPIRPVNADKFLLISAGPDGVFGSTKDVSNLPAFTE
jgi:prepilin-type N-terminal cleavage/methylation domain-containing protein